MAQINDPVLGGALAVELVSRAARVVQTHSDGSTVVKKLDGTYHTRLELVPSTLTAGTVYWSMRNNGSKKAVVRQLAALITFAGVAAATRSAYELVRFSGANMTGGTSVAAVKGSNVDDTNTAVTDIRFAPAGLTTSGVTFELNGIAILAHANQLGSQHDAILNFADTLVLEPGEGLAIRASTAIVAGSGIHGLVNWGERS